MQISFSPLPDKPKEGAFDVHVLVIDSVSMSHFRRALPLTNHYIQNKLDATVFPYLNKVGHGSRFNGYGILIGKRFLKDF